MEGGRSDQLLSKSSLDSLPYQSGNGLLPEVPFGRQKGANEAQFGLSAGPLTLSRNCQLTRPLARVFENPPPPKLRRELLIPILAYRIQEKTLGGLRPSTARRLQAIVDEIGEGKKPAARSHGSRPGTRMVRQWQGKLYEVVTLESGFMFDGQKYRSLSQIARAITGTRWSGPAFFGLKKRRSEVAA